MINKNEEVLYTKRYFPLFGSLAGFVAYLIWAILLIAMSVILCYN